MLKTKLKKKYDFFEFNSELKIPSENNLEEKESLNLIKNKNLIIEEELNQYNNNLKIENSTFVIKAQNKIIIIFSVDKDLPPKIEKNIYYIPLTNPVLQAISFMKGSQNESIIISTGDSIDNIEVLQFQLKKLMHDATYNLLNNIKNAIKIIPIKDSLALVLHYSTKKYKDGGLKLWKLFEEEIYNFNKVYNFTFNHKYNKIICVDNKEAPFTFSIYSFDNYFFNQDKNELLQPDFFISLEEYIKNIKENEIELFLHFESFSNIICFWAKALSGYLFSIIFINFKENKLYDYVEFIFQLKNKYFFKINKISNEIYIFNLTDELLFIYSFKKHETDKKILSSEDLYITKIHFSGNIKGIDFTENNGLVILSEENNLVCYSKNESVFKVYQKEYKKDNNELNDSLLNKNLNEEDLKKINNDLNKTFLNSDIKSKNNIINKNEELSLVKSKSENTINNNLYFEKINLNNNKKIELKNDKKEINILRKKSNIIQTNNNINNIKLDSYSQTPKDFNKINKVDNYCQTDENKEENIENENENEKINIKEKNLNEGENDKDENKINLDITKDKLDKNYKNFIKQNEIIDKFISSNNNNLILNKTIKLFKENISKLENNLLKGISQNELNNKYNEAKSVNSILNNNIKINNKTLNYLNYKYKDIELELIKTKYFIVESKSFIKDIEYTKNKIIELIKNRNYETKNSDKKNCDYKSIELINGAFNFELKDENEIKKQIENLLYKCNDYEEKINIISEINSYGINNKNELNYLLYKCKYDIDKIREMYKYNKFSAQKENEYIYLLINPFLIFFNEIIQYLEIKINIVSQEIMKLNINTDEKTYLFLKEKYYNKCDTENKKIKDKKNKDKNLDEMLSDKLEELYEENNFYSSRGNIINYKCINIDDEFKK